MRSNRRPDVHRRAHTRLAAQKALAAGDPTTAIEKLNQAVQVDPNYAEAYLLLGLTEFQRGETAKSIEHYQRALKLQPGSYSGHYNLALAYLRDHKLQEGRAQLEQAVKLDPSQPDAVYDLGVVLLEQGHPAQALGYLTRARKLNPRRPDVAFNMVRAELEAGHVAEARTEAQAAAQRVGSDPQVERCCRTALPEEWPAERCGCLSSCGQYWQSGKCRTSQSTGACLSAIWPVSAGFGTHC